MTMPTKKPGVIKRVLPVSPSESIEPVHEKEPLPLTMKRVVPLTAKRVLVADDEVDLARAIGLRLSRKGYGVDLAHDGATTMMKATQRRPDLILLDLRMPAGDGMTVCHRLRKNASTMDIPVIILTAHVSVPLRREAKGLGVQHFLQKPCPPERLLGCVEDALGE